MKLNLPKFNLPLRHIITSALGVITLSTFMGLFIVSDADGKEYTPAQWVLTITGSFSAAGWTILLLDRSWATEEHLVELQEAIEYLACEVEVFYQVVQGKELSNVDNAQAVEVQARNTLLDKIRELKAESNPMQDLENAIGICLDFEFWDEPARYKYRYQDTKRFFDNELICPVNHDGRVYWNVCSEYASDDESDVRQTPFAPFDCCICCKYIAEDPCACAVVPLGCETSDPEELCREFVSQDSDFHVHLFVPRETLPTGSGQELETEPKPEFSGINQPDLKSGEEIEDPRIGNEIISRDARCTERGSVGAQRDWRGVLEFLQESTRELSENARELSANTRMLEESIESDNRKSRDYLQRLRESSQSLKDLTK